MPSVPPSPESLVAGLYGIDPARPLPGFGGAGAFAAHREGVPGDFVAIEVAAGSAPRALPLQALAGAEIPGLMLPLAHGPARLSGRKPAYFVICPAPPGPSLATGLAAWPQERLLALVLRPVAKALERLAACGVTHRAIRPDNLFQATPSEPLVLGPAWAAPPASRQPALYEPPYVIQCHPAGRGDGTIADDVYALGVLLAVLALGRQPLADHDPDAIVRRKLAIGSYAAMAAEGPLPGALAEIVRAMLAEDPQARPTPQQLLDPAFERARRAPAQVARRAPEPLMVGTQEIFLPRPLAHALAIVPQQGVRLLRLGVIDRWVRRSLGDTALAQGIIEALDRRAREAGDGEERADALLLLRSVALLDPLAPLVWRNLAFWPEGLGPLLADGGGAAELEGAIAAEAVAAWAACRPGRPATAALSLEARRWRALCQGRGLARGLRRLCYLLNPLLACRSALIGDEVVMTVPALLTALDAAAREPDRRRELPLDADILAFVLAKVASGLEPDLARLSSLSAASDEAGSEKAKISLRVFAALQRSTHTAALPGLASWLAERAEPIVAGWKERGRRAAVQERLLALADTGNLSAMAALIEDPAARARDAQGLKEANSVLRSIDHELAAISASGPVRAEAARRLGQEIAAGLGLAAVAAATLLLALG
ncbi:MAG: hypothetical protein ACREFN_07235 [Acetobacteraceae bacterium]